MAEDSPTVINILMGMKEDVGEIRASASATKESLESIIATNSEMNKRVTALEMRAEREKGFFIAARIGMAAAGAVAVYAIQFLGGWLKAKVIG